MQYRPIVLALTTAAILAGCNSAKDASKSNFQSVIDKAITKDCAYVGPNASIISNSQNYPQSVPLVQVGTFVSADEAKKQDQANLGPYEALVKAGLLVGKDDQVPTLMSNGKTVPGRTYSLTDEGKKYLKDPNGTGLKFCAAKYKVDEVTQFTQPGQSVGGTTLSEVQFTYSPVNVAPWANNPDLNAVYGTLAKQLAPHQQGQAQLGLMNDGWTAGNVALKYYYF